MKRIMTIVVLLLTSYWVIGTPARPLFAQTLLARPTPSATNTPAPTPTQTPAPTLAPYVPGFDPYDGAIGPALGLYEVGPLSGDYLSLYTFPKDPNKFLPATYFPLYNQSSKAFILSFDLCPISGELGNLMLKLDSVKTFNYITSIPNGIRASDSLRTVIFPLNTVNVTSVAFLKAGSKGQVPQWWAVIQTIPCTIHGLQIDPTTIPPYLLQHQSDMTYNGALSAGLPLMGFDAIVPLISTHPVWVPLAQLEIIPPPPTATPTVTPTDTPTATPTITPADISTDTPIDTSTGQP
ncbi:MAG: hypothetical protein WCA79_09480 [Anaerolineales bacterium]